MPIHRKAVPFGMINTWRVASFIRAKGIELVHSHSRRAHWVAAQAAKITKIPHVTTVHQPLPVHFFSKHFPCLGDETIAIDEAVVQHLLRKFNHPAEKIHLIRNGLDLSRALPSVRQTPNVKQVLLIGRLSGGRWAAFQFFLDVLERIAKTLPPANYKIVGQIPGDKRPTLERMLSLAYTKIMPSTVEVMGFVKDLGALIRNSDAAIAAGRSAIEGMAHGRPVVFLGEGGVIGLRKPEVWANALKTNFGDHLEPKDFSPAKLESALREVLTSRANEQDLNAWARTQVEKDFDIRKIAGQVEAVYARAAKS
jgi:glycosyltransferase involved in cell wall biosynthesis